MALISPKAFLNCTLRVQLKVAYRKTGAQSLFDSAAMQNQICEGKDPSLACKKNLDTAATRGYSWLLERHLRNYQSLFNRVSLDLGSPSSSSLPTTEERIRKFHQSHDPLLPALLFNYGRYLLISSSRPGTQPANLQGIWNENLRPPWSSNWTLNINAEMNYWPAESCNLSECHEPLLQFIRELAINGAKTAQVNYGARGWVAHHNADLWRQSAPVEDGSGDPVWANWSMGGAWLCSICGSIMLSTAIKLICASRPGRQ